MRRSNHEERLLTHGFFLRIFKGGKLPRNPSPLLKIWLLSEENKKLTTEFGTHLRQKSTEKSVFTVSLEIGEDED